MYSTEYELYFDVKPPPTVLSSWRNGTERPGDERPDILVRERKTNRVALLDAKFRRDRDPRRPQSEDLFELQGYMNSFSIPNAGVIYPGSEPRPRTLSAGGKSLLELPIRAGFFDANSSSYLANIREAIANQLCSRLP